MDKTLSIPTQAAHVAWNEPRRASTPPVACDLPPSPRLASRSCGLLVARRGTLPAGDGQWLPYAVLDVPPGDTLAHEFPAGFSAHWIRFTAGGGGTATAVLTYE